MQSHNSGVCRDQHVQTELLVQIPTRVTVWDNLYNAQYRAVGTGPASPAAARPKFGVPAKKWCRITK